MITGGKRRYPFVSISVGFFIFLLYVSPSYGVEIPTSLIQSSAGTDNVQPSGEKRPGNGASGLLTAAGESRPRRTKRIAMIEGRSHVLRFTTKVNRISVSNPAVLDFLTLSPTEVLLNAKQHGSVNLIIWNSENKIATFNINVTRDPGLLDQLLRKIDSEGRFEIFPSKDVFVVRGEATSVKNMKRIQEAVENFSRGSISLVRVKHVKQVLLQTRFIKIDHTKNHDFGIDFEHITDRRTSNFAQRFLPGSTSAATDTNATNSRYTATYGTFDIFSRNDTDLYQIVYASGDRAFEGFIKAIEEAKIGKVIARPNLLAKDGEEASFVVGGEVPIVISTGEELNVEYKEFGTRLKFTPEIMDEGEIMLTIEPEVSSLSSGNSVTVGNSTIKGFQTTRVKTVVHLHDNETFMLGGLIQQTLETNETGVPFFRRIPLLGKLFESFDHNWTETELLVVVTPKIIEAERAPILMDNEKDILGKATQLLPSQTKIDRQSGALRSYVTERKRWDDTEDRKRRQEIEVLENELKKLALKKGGRQARG